MNCPICDKAGLPKNAITCPQCNSDLSGFLHIDKIAEQQKHLEANNTQLHSEVTQGKAKRRNIIVISSLLLVASFGFMSWFSNANNKKLVDTSGSDNSKVDSLAAVIAQNEVRIKRFEDENQALKEQQNRIKYVVKKGDNLIKIARFFYNDEARYQDIMKENNMEENAPLFVGDTLTLNPKN
jgi:outer membrane murein-binding lipoprotein Lpp